MGWIVPGRGLGLILRQGDEDLLVIDVDSLDRPRRDDDLPPEDPRPRVHHDVGEPCIERGLFDLSDRSISRLWEHAPWARFLERLTRGPRRREEPSAAS